MHAQQDAIEIPPPGHRHTQSEINLRPRETFKIGQLLQHPVQPGRGNLEAVVIDVFDGQNARQLIADQRAIFNVDTSGLFNAIDEHPQHAPTRTLLEIHELDDAADANRALKAGEVAGIYTVDDAGTPKLTLLSSYGSSRATSVLTDRSILETVASSYTQNAELMSQIAQDNPAALADPEAVARALSLEGGTRRVSLTRATPDGTVIYYYALFGLVAMMSAEFAALSVIDLQPNLSGLGARRCVGGLSKTASLAGIFVGSWLVSFASMMIAIGYVRLVVGVDFGGREGLCLVGGAASALAATGLGLFVGTLPVKGGKASKSGILTGFATTCALFAGLYGEPAMALADDVARACPAECWLNPVKLICDMFNRLYFFEDLGPFAVRAGALVLMALVFVAAATLIFGRSRYEHL